MMMRASSEASLLAMAYFVPRRAHTLRTAARNRNHTMTKLTRLLSPAAAPDLGAISMMLA